MLDVDRLLRVRLPYGRVPKPFQIEGVKFAVDRGFRCLIGDAMGLGKSIQALCTLAVAPKDLLPAVIVCPSSMFYTWKSELETWLPTVPVKMLAKASTALPPPGYKGVVICTWGLLEAHGEALAAQGFRYLIADEAHYGIHAESIRSAAFRRLGHAVPHVLLLSGTPLRNRVRELWHLLHVLDPAAFPNEFEFSKTYGGEDGPAKLQPVLKRYMIRRLKKDVLQDLPEKQRIFVPVEFDRTEYDEAEAEFRRWLGQQAHFGNTASQTAALARLGHLRRIVGQAKAPAAVEHITRLVEEREQVIAFVEHVAVLEAVTAGLEAQGLRYGVIQGDVSKTQRHAIVQAFQRGQLDVVVGTQAMKEGVTLTKASNVVFVERWWTPADEEQGEDRAHRIGQKSAVSVWYMRGADTVDDRIGALVEKKRQISAAAIGGQAITHSESDLLADFFADWRAGKKATTRNKNEKGSAVPTASDLPPLPDPKQTQSLLFAVEEWKLADIQLWTRIHRYPVLRVEALGRYHRAIVRENFSGSKTVFETRKLSKNLSAVVRK